MTSPYALLLSIAGTVCMFILTLIGIIADATIAPTPAVDTAMASSTVAVVAQDVRHGDPVPIRSPRCPTPAAPLRGAAERDDGSTPSGRGRARRPHHRRERRSEDRPEAAT